MRVKVDTELCCSSGNCVLTAPDVFDQRDYDGVVQLRQESPDASVQGEVREAARMCPSRAIQVAEDG